MGLVLKTTIRVKRRCDGSRIQYCGFSLGPAENSGLRDLNSPCPESYGRKM